MGLFDAYVELAVKPVAFYRDKSAKLSLSSISYITT